MMDRESLAQKHTTISFEFLEAADRFFEEDDLIQVSEKLWGATAHAMKSVCIRRSWQHDKHAHLRSAVERLTAETGDQLLMSGFLLAYSHHLNFYTDAIAMDAEDIDPARPVIRSLVDRLLTAAG